MTPTFTPVDGTEYKLQDISVIGADGDGDVQIQLLSKDGSLLTTYFWYTVDGWDMEKDGWYTIDESPAPETLKTGVGIFVHTSKDNIELQVSGQVELTVSNEIVSGYTFSGNSTPIAISVQDIKAIGADGDGDVQIQILSKEGSLGTTYFWYTIDGWDMEEDGWYTISEEKAEITLQAGDALFFHTSKDGVKLALPSPIK